MIATFEQMSTQSGTDPGSQKIQSALTMIQVCI